MRITKEMKETVIRFDEKNPTAEIATANAALKRRLSDYARDFPTLCRLADDDDFGTQTFVIDKQRISLRLTKPYSDERRQTMSDYAKDNNTIDHVKRRT